MTTDLAIKPAPLLGAGEASQRVQVLAAPGSLGAVMRAFETRAWRSPEFPREVWLWVLFLTIVRGYRGETTVADYVAHVARFGEWAEDAGYDYTALHVAQVDEWQKWLYLRRRNGAPARRQALMSVRSFCKWRATRTGANDPTEGYAAPKRWQRAPRKYSAKELRALFVAAKKNPDARAAMRDTTMLLLLLAAGLRREEIITLRLDQLDIGERTGMVRVFGKGAKERTVPIEGPIVQRLAQWLLVRGEIENLKTDAVFVNLSHGHLGTPASLSTVERVVSCAARSAGLREWGVHRFRVTYATLMYDDGVDIERIRILMGHESIETTRRYLAVSSRMNRCRLKAHRQHAALGSIPADMPLWAQELEKRKHGTSGIF